MSTVDEDSARSHAVAGMLYITVGGLICTIAILKMRSGVRTIPWSERFGGHFELPLEMVAGIAAIVVFMGFLQLLVAFILKIRRRRHVFRRQPNQ